MISGPYHILSRYSISSHHGFLPDVPPLHRLPQSYYRHWEIIMDVLPDLINLRLVRSSVDSMPMLDTSELSSEVEWRRAYLVLSFITHAYIWGDREPSQILPPTICHPYLEVADHFGLPTTATYAAFNLWNWSPTHVGADVTNPDNIRMLHTFTATPDEEWFYLISVAIEAQGSKILPAMLECFEAVELDCSFKVIQLLEAIAGIITQLGLILDRMHERCDPCVFYHRIRPFLAGSKGMATVGLPKGVFYDEGDGYGSWRQYSGGSNAQSSLIQLLDIMLGVEHYATDKTNPDPKIVATKTKHGYIEEMRRYMPEQHKFFLQHVTEQANIRTYAMKDETGAGVRAAYSEAVESLTTFRDKHMGIVARYIIAPSRKAVSLTANGCTNIATASSQQSSGNRSDRAELCGTGGTHLMPFLKQTRDETKNAGVIPSVVQSS